MGGLQMQNGMWDKTWWYSFWTYKYVNLTLHTFTFYKLTQKNI
jgi:hypothetical protein